MHQGDALLNPQRWSRPATRSLGLAAPKHSAQRYITIITRIINLDTHPSMTTCPSADTSAFSSNRRLVKHWHDPRSET
jgi:hypothetical protein